MAFASLDPFVIMETLNPSYETELRDKQQVILDLIKKYEGTSLFSSYFNLLLVLLELRPATFLSCQFKNLDTGMKYWRGTREALEAYNRDLIGVVETAKSIGLNVVTDTENKMSVVNCMISKRPIGEEVVSNETAIGKTLDFLCYDTDWGLDSKGTRYGVNYIAVETNQQIYAETCGPPKTLDEIREFHAKRVEKWNRVLEQFGYSLRLKIDRFDKESRRWISLGST
jgi:hypothetical protein